MDRELKSIFNLLYRIMDNPNYRDQMIEDQKRKMEWRKKSYYQKLKYYEDDPEWIVEYRERGDRGSGWTAYPKNSKKGKEINSRLLREKKEEEKRIFESENPLDAAVDHVLGMGVDSIDRSGLRKISDKYMGFNVDRFSEFQTMVTDEGIKVK